MPTVLRPARTVSSSTRATRRSHRTFTSNETTTPPSSGLGPVRLQSSGGFKPVGIRRIQRLVEQHREALLRSWDAYFNEGPAGRPRGRRQGDRRRADRPARGWPNVGGATRLVYTSSPRQQARTDTVAFHWMRGSGFIGPPLTRTSALRASWRDGVPVKASNHSRAGSRGARRPGPTSAVSPRRAERAAADTQRWTVQERLFRRIRPEECLECEASTLWLSRTLRPGCMSDTCRVGQVRTARARPSTS